MVGTFVNTGAIIAGSLIGGCIKKEIRADYHTSLFTAMGLAACGIGINAVASNVPNSAYPVLFIVSMAGGALLGTFLQLETRFFSLMEQCGQSQLQKGLSTAILLFCIGTLSILGPVQSALYGDNTYLFTNAALDFVTSIALASTYGFGIMAAGAVLLVWQGCIYFGAASLQGFLTPELMTELSSVSGLLILGSGLGILNIKDCKTMNLLPALLGPVIFFAVKGLF